MEELVMVLAVVALGVRVGQALVATGAVRAKNAASAGLRALLNVSAAAIGFWAIGSAILLSGAKVIGVEPGLLVGWNPTYGHHDLLAYLVLAVIAAGTLNGALAERTPLIVPAWAAGCVGAIIMPLAGLWVWHGWLRSLGFTDVGGATMLHLTGGITAAVGVAMTGARNGKYNRDGSSNVIPGFNIPWVLLGSTLTAICWIALVDLAARTHGSAAAAINVILASSAAVLACITISRLRTGKVDVLLTWSALLGGLVAISAAGGSVHGLLALAIGAVAGAVVPWLTVQVDLRWKFDDPAGVVVPSIFGAVWGTLAVGAFVCPTPVEPSLLDRLSRFAVHVLGVLTIALLSMAAAVILFAILKATVGLRVRSGDEYDGLDLAEHDINAHPDFQQTMIKSYHSREA